MTITQATCSQLDQCSKDYETYVEGAIGMVAGPRIDPGPETTAQQILQFEVLHTEPVCRIVMADACVILIAKNDLDIRFVAPTTEMAVNYVSYWHREAPASPGDPGLRPLADSQTTNSAEVAILGQTLPDELAVAGGEGYLHYVEDVRPGDGWTIRVGVWHPNGVGSLSDLELGVTVSARPDWTPSTAEATVLIP